MVFAFFQKITPTFAAFWMSLVWRKIVAIFKTGTPMVKFIWISYESERYRNIVIVPWKKQRDSGNGGGGMYCIEFFSYSFL